jgi:hypothetical protein
MIWAQIHVRSETHLPDDFRKLVTLTAAIKNQYERGDLEDAIRELEEVLLRLGVARDEGSVQTAAPVLLNS